MSLLHFLVSRQTESEKEYGIPLTTNNGRNPLIDALQEKLDTIMYLRQAIEDTQNNVELTFSKNYHISKEPKPIKRVFCQNVIDLIIYENLDMIYLDRYDNVPNELKSLYLNEIYSATVLIQYIEEQKEKQ